MGSAGKGKKGISPQRAQRPQSCHCEEPYGDEAIQKTGLWKNGLPRRNAVPPRNDGEMKGIRRVCFAISGFYPAVCAIEATRGQGRSGHGYHAVSGRGHGGHGDSRHHSGHVSGHYGRMSVSRYRLWGRWISSRVAIYGWPPAVFVSVRPSTSVPYNTSIPIIGINA